MARTLLTFGDSNTHGTPPIVTRGEYARYGPDIRWPTVVNTQLGSDWVLVEEGLPGRTTQFEDPIMGAHMNGRVGLRIALHSHGPIDFLTIMLGTNDLKTRFAPTPQLITAGIAGLLDIAINDEMQTRHRGFQILLICPAPVLEQGPIAGEFIGARDITLHLAPAFQALAVARGVGFLDAGTIVQSSPQDGIHLTAEAHQTLAGAITEHIRDL